jgi:hypothetical protein
VPEYLWEEHLLNDGPTPWVESNDQKPSLRRAMKMMRRQVLRWWVRRVTTSLLSWIKLQHPALKKFKPPCPVPSELIKRQVLVKDEVTWQYLWTEPGKSSYCLWWKYRAVVCGKDTRPGADTVIRAAKASWWEWEDGSRPFH